MKTKLLYLILFVTFCANAQIVNIPDPVFKAKLVQSTATSSVAQDVNGNALKVDTNNDGQIQFTEAQNIYKLYLNQLGITNLTGITNFNNLRSLVVHNQYNLPDANLSGLSNLEELDLHNNHILNSLNINGLTSLKKLQLSYLDITSIDLASAINLTDVSIQSTDLTTIDLSPLTNLKVLMLYNNQLSTLNVSMLSQLETLGCGSNNLTTLDVSDLLNLKSVWCDGNNISQLNFSNCPVLTNLNCRYNNITSLNLTEHEQLLQLACDNNLIADIDLSTCVNLNYLYISNNLLTTLDLRAQSALNELYFSNCPNLVSLYIKNGHFELGGESPFQTGVQVDYICADEDEIPQLQTLLSSWGLTDVVVNSFCPLAPTADFNVITGVGTIDNDNNGCSETDDVRELVKFKINDGTNQGACFTNSAGRYNFLTGAGNFTVEPEFENDYFTVSPVSATVNFPVVDGSVVTKDFCIQPNGIHNDIEVVIAPIIPARPGFNATYKIVYKNKGNQVLSGSVVFTYQEPVLDFFATDNPNYIAAAGTVTWAYSNLMPFESRSITITMIVNSPLETPAVNNGDILTYGVAAPIVADETPADNSFTLEQTVVGSYDPNNIICLEGEIEPVSSIGNYLHYMVNFENTGTFQAEKVELKLNVDTSKYDINSLQILDHSHPIMIAKVTGNQISFLYEPIYLAATDHGNILFKLKSKSDLNSGTTVTNQANIYFDFNPAVATNIANTTFQSLSTGNWTKDDSVKVYPNPSAGMVKIEASSAINSIELYDVQGRLIEVQKSGEMNTSLDITTRATGIYFIKVVTDKGAKVEKIVRE